MDLELADFRTRGRAAKVLAPIVVRDLRPEDFALLSVERGIEPPPIQKLRARHHTLARLIAQGTSVPDCSAITGYSGSRISILLGDPTFTELVSYYAGLVEEKYLDTHARLGELTTDAAELLRERMEDPETAKAITVGQLTEIIKLGADRTGFGPTTTQNTNVTVGFASRLEEARKRVAQRTLELSAEKSDAA